MKLTRKGFRAWLESKHPRSRVGVSRVSRSCPIAMYLSSVNGKIVSVSAGEWRFMGHVYPMPKWGCNFIDGVDGYSMDTRITASRALKILDGK